MHIWARSVRSELRYSSAWSSWSLVVIVSPEVGATTAVVDVAGPSLYMSITGTGDPEVGGYWAREKSEGIDWSPNISGDCTNYWTAEGLSQPNRYAESLWSPFRYRRGTLWSSPVKTRHVLSIEEKSGATSTSIWRRLRILTSWHRHAVHCACRAACISPNLLSVECSGRSDRTRCGTRGSDVDLYSCWIKTSRPSRKSEVDNEFHNASCSF